MNFNTNISIKRIIRDITEIHRDKLPGLGACIPDVNNPFVILANIQILDGIYKGLIVPLIIRLTQKYPISPPLINIIAGHPFNGRFHEHIIDDYIDDDSESEDQLSQVSNSNEAAKNKNQLVGASICADLTDNYAWYFQEENNEENQQQYPHSFTNNQGISGWTPAYTLQSVLLQLQVFLADSYLPPHSVPHWNERKSMIHQAKYFSFEVQVFDGKGYQAIRSTNDKPYPKVYGQDDCLKSNKQQQRLPSCLFTKATVTDQKSNSVFGYPIKIDFDKFGRLQCVPLLEMTSREGVEFLKSETADQAQDGSLSILGQEFNYWIPLYINQEHFERSGPMILSTLSKLQLDQQQQYIQRNTIMSFDLDMIIKIFPTILVKTAIHFIQGKIQESQAAVDCYCQFYFTFLNLINNNPELQDQIDQQVQNFLQDPGFRHKRKVGDLGEFIIKASLSTGGLRNKGLNRAILEESMTRQISWAIQKDEILAKYGPDTRDLLRRYLLCTSTSRQFLTMQWEIASILRDEAARELMEQNYGFLPDFYLGKVRAKLTWLKENMSKDWQVLVKVLGLTDVIPNGKIMIETIQQAFENAFNKYPEDIQKAYKNCNMSFNNPNTRKFQYNQIQKENQSQQQNIPKFYSQQNYHIQELQQQKQQQFQYSDYALKQQQSYQSNSQTRSQAIQLTPKLQPKQNFSYDQNNSFDASPSSYYQKQNNYILEDVNKSAKSTPEFAPSIRSDSLERSNSRERERQNRNQNSTKEQKLISILKKKDPKKKSYGNDNQEHYTRLCGVEIIHNKEKEPKLRRYY